MLVACACADPTSSSEPAPVAIAAPTGDPARGRELIAHFECNRCHEGAGEDAPTADRQCVGCHRSILRGSFDAPVHRLAQWRGALHSLNVAPSLDGLSGHLRHEWIERFLVHPYDVRPALSATMPRLDLDGEQAADIAAALTYGAPTQESARAFSPEAARGSTLLHTKGCLSCHAFSGIAEPPSGANDAIRLAPDLRFTRDRMTRAALAAWLRAPERVRPGTLMPTPALSNEELELLTDFILSAPLAPLPAPSVPERLPILTRPVRFAEVAERLFRVTCWHCHADPDFARGDGGPGNTGGFGYSGRRVALHDYASVSSGYLTEDGERRSLFALDGETPHLVRVLMARYHELAGEPIEGITGMPLGLPPIALEEIQLLETWIAQGRPL